MESANEDLLSVLPSAGEWREEDYLWVTRNTRRLIELQAGNLEFLPMPTRQHQLIVAAVFLALHEHLTPRGGLVLFAPLRVRISEGRFREPDVMALSASTDPRNDDAFWSGADLVAEVISPDDPNRDLVTKRDEYALARVSEYWILDPRDSSVTVLVLDGAGYRQHGVFFPGSPMTSATLPDFSVRVETLFPRG